MQKRSKSSQNSLRKNHNIHLISTVLDQSGMLWLWLFLSVQSSITLFFRGS